MTYLLDVNALVALGFMNYEFHGRLASWVQGHDCSIGLRLSSVDVLASTQLCWFFEDIQ